MVDVLCPDFADDLDQGAGAGLLELNHHERLQVPLLVLVWEVRRIEPGGRPELHRPDVVFVSVLRALAGDLDEAVLDTLNGGGAVVEGVWRPVEQLVHLEEHTWPALVEAVVEVAGALVAELANGVLARQIGVPVEVVRRAVHQAALNLGGLRVRFQVLVEVCGVFPVCGFHSLLEPYHRFLHIRLRTESHAWVVLDQAVPVLQSGLVILDGAEEGKEEASPDAGQAQVEHQVEGCNLSPASAVPVEHRLLPGVEDKAAEGGGLLLGRLLPGVRVADGLLLRLLLLLPAFILSYLRVRHIPSGGLQPTVYPGRVLGEYPEGVRSTPLDLPRTPEPSVLPSSRRLEERLGLLA